MASTGLIDLESFAKVIPHDEHCECDRHERGVGEYVGGGIPMMDSDASGGNIGPSMQLSEYQRQQLNTYIYEYFIRNRMFDCAQSLLNSEKHLSAIEESPRRRQANGNGMRNGTPNHGDSDNSKGDMNSETSGGLSVTSTTQESPESSFLYEWWCLFWDMFTAQRGRGEERQQLLLNLEMQSQIMDQMMPAHYGQIIQLREQNGMSIGQVADLTRNAIHNTMGNQTPQEMQFLQQNNSMQRDPSGGNQQPPGSWESPAPPSKRPRLEASYHGFNFEQPPSDSGQPIPQQSRNISCYANIQHSGLALDESILAHHLASQIEGKEMPGVGRSTNQEYPTMVHGKDASPITAENNADKMPAGLRVACQQAGQPDGNYVLRNYQTQLMLLDQDIKTRHRMAYQEQDTLVTAPEGRDDAASEVINPNARLFQGTTSPHGTRFDNSPNCAPQQNIAGAGTPQQWQMPPPVTPAIITAGTTNDRPPGSPQRSATMPTPQHANKPNSNTNKAKDIKAKRATKNRYIVNLDAGIEAFQLAPVKFPIDNTKLTISSYEFDNPANGSMNDLQDGDFNLNLDFDPDFAFD